MTADDIWSDTAWNGVSLHLPESLPLAELDLNALRAVAADGVTRLELKWQHVGESFSRKRHLEKIRKQLPKQSGFSTAVEDIPESWKSADSPFSWREEGDLPGVGAILHAPAKGYAALVQYVGHNPQTGADILNSIAFHAADAPMPFNIFGISLLAPSQCALTAFNFSPGHFRLTFACKDAECTLDRLAPADTLLKQSTLAGIAQQLYGNDDIPPFEELPSGEAVSVSELAPGLTRRLLPGAKPYIHSQAWLNDSNKLLAILVRASTPEALSIFDHFTDSYASV